MRIDVLTILPEMVEQAVSHSILGRAVEAGIVQIRAVNVRDYATDKHHTTDDTPCGGGGGMLMKPEPIGAALDALKAEGVPSRVILTDPAGEVFTQAKARELAQEEHLVFLCGRYEGVDERVRELFVTDSLSIGDYVLTGGELPSLVMLDAVVRLLPGALGDKDAPAKDSFAEPLLEYPQYTRPREYRGLAVPEILFSGHHALIEKWRRWHQLTRTREQRPDLWEKFALSKADEKIIALGEPKVSGEKS
jgi:tRNA (guanine37-N1)-methyltransferase